MKKFWYLLVSIILLLISFTSLRLSFPYFEINQTLSNKQFLVNNGVNFDLGGVFVKAVSPGSPASEEGIDIYSQITQIDGNGISNSVEFLNSVRSNQGKQIVLIVCKSNTCKNVQIIPRAQSASNEGPLGIQVQDVSSYRKSTIQIIIEQIYNRYFGQDFFTQHFGPQVIIVSWISLIIGIISLVFSVKLAGKAFRN